MDFSNINNQLNELFGKVTRYFSGLTLYEQIAWGAIMLGVVLVLSSFFF
jgi:hypothetical protein